MAKNQPGLAKRIINRLYRSYFFSAVFHTTVYCLQKELKDCESVLDLGCGPSSPVQYAKNIRYSVGVEAYGPYLHQARKEKTHSKFLESRVEEVDFSENSFDAVLMIEVMEHMPEDKGLEMIAKATRWAKKKVIISTPNGFLPQRERDGNQLQKHLSGWSMKTMKNLGFRCNGLAGFAFLRYEAPPEEMKDNFMASIKKKPRFFWFVIATLSQLYTYKFPKSAFEIFCVKEIK